MLKGASFVQEFTTLAALFKNFSDVSKHVLLWCSQTSGEYTEEEVKGRFARIQAAQTTKELDAVLESPAASGSQFCLRCVFSQRIDINFS